jgi:hypothetical protein
MRQIRRWAAAVVAAAAVWGLAGAARADSKNGPHVIKETVKGNTIDVYTFFFREGEPAVVTVVGDGGTDLDLIVLDENGNLIDADDDPGDQCLAMWTPKWTGKFTIKVVNQGRTPNRYTLRTN